MQNPFLNPSLLNRPLSLEAIQTIHFAAINRVLQTGGSTSVPAKYDLDQLRRRVRKFGREICLAHPSDLAMTFRCMTTDLYHVIVDLYSDPIGRSIHTIHQILTVMAQHGEQTPPGYDAVWATCLYMEVLHQKRAVLKKLHTDTTWYVCLVPTAIRAMDQYGEFHLLHVLVTVAETNPPKVVCFRLVTEMDDDAVLLMLYEALSEQREPMPRETAGLIWHLPRLIRISESLHPTVVTLCQGVEIPIVKTGSDELTDATRSLLITIESDTRNHPFRTMLSIPNCKMLFDTYLYKAHGYSPYRERAKRQVQWRDLTGYNRDPGGLLPMLRQFLPVHHRPIEDNGIQINGLHYEHDLLAYWPGALVTGRISPLAESRCWIYLDNEVLCEARARELRRRDGTYRDNRIR
jgi:hypothetical protein